MPKPKTSAVSQGSVCGPPEVQQPKLRTGLPLHKDVFSRSFSRHLKCKKKRISEKIFSAKKSYPFLNKDLVCKRSA